MHRRFVCPGNCLYGEVCSKKNIINLFNFGLSFFFKKKNAIKNLTKRYSFHIAHRCTRHQYPCTTASFVSNPTYLQIFYVHSGATCRRKNSSPLKKPPLKASARRSQRRLENRCRQRSGGCGGSARETTLCRVTLGDHVVRRLVCLYVFSLNFVVSHLPKCAWFVQWVQ